MTRHPSSPEPSPRPSRRDLLKTAAAAALGVAAGQGLPQQNTHAAERKPDKERNAIQIENEKEGAKDWQLTRVRLDKRDGFRSPWVEGYCSRQSVKAGESLEIFVSTDPPRKFQIEIFRTGYLDSATFARASMNSGRRKAEN